MSDPATSGIPTRILVIEDEVDIRDVIEYNLRRVGFDVATCSDGAIALATARVNRPDLIVLDVMLPSMDGRDICRSLRAEQATASIPIIMLTARDSEQDIIDGLALGADDYLTKPFRPRELVARVQARLRRVQPHTEVDAGVLRSGSIELDTAQRSAIVNGTRIHFTGTEARLLEALMMHSQTIMSRRRLLTLATGSDAWISERTIDVHVKAVRRKLGSEAARIETVRGAGYRWREGIS